MMEFLYFPEDKSEYIPAAIMCFVFMLAAVVTMVLIIKHSKKQEKIMLEQERAILNDDSNKPIK